MHYSYILKLDLAKELYTSVTSKDKWVPDAKCKIAFTSTVNIAMRRGVAVLIIMVM